jgi:hypothetical protein
MINFNKEEFQRGMDNLVDDKMKEIIVSKVPEAQPYKDLIKITLIDGKAQADLSLLPEDIKIKINEAWAAD